MFQRILSLFRSPAAPAKAAPRPPHLEVVIHNTSRKGFVRLRAANGEILMSTETYANESNVRRSARNIAEQTGFEVREGA